MALYAASLAALLSLLVVAISYDSSALEVAAPRFEPGGARSQDRHAGEAVAATVDAFYGQIGRASMRFVRTEWSPAAAGVHTSSGSLWIERPDIAELDSSTGAGEVEVMLRVFRGAAIMARDFDIEPVTVLASVRDIPCNTVVLRPRHSPGVRELQLCVGSAAEISGVVLSARVVRIDSSWSFFEFREFDFE